MGKLKLDLDALHVESFQAQPEKAERRGTVEGQEFTFGCNSWLNGTCAPDFTCGNSCQGTCGVTCYLSKCDQFCPQTGTTDTLA
ncbi:MAG: hypothetical protein JO306_01605 [Gemmatimonadetes bacterium]|nr:hypothetical protein [Gemmatimonadota bacterium]